ncbi:hypothetical protein GBA65_07025 [Rubrobacter marinus]|uniref:Helix-turn-helix domain-containing protein n=1 Tax=Rubrobacter marinus TaxID=2653852 RepID=A0A6G8PVW2_9ACTN|nr:hypothetical protein [Rubrobacter marinus]QIN78307.1 hypothetical protein GBA65_07025 [Rubrobacter marinus]
MSVWAQSWAYEQRLGRWRETGQGKRSWKGDPGAKSVLAAVATFADEQGYAFCGQDTLAEMTDMTERSVREHLYNLEHGYGKIRREHRRKGSGRGRGEFTSDGIWLLAPAHRLRPPRRGEAVEAEPAEEFSDGEKRAHGRKSLPPGGRKGFPGNRKGVEPSGDPSGVRASPEHRPETYVGMIEEQARLLSVPLDGEEVRNLRAYAGRLVEEQGAGPLPMLRWAARYATRRVENPKIRPSQAWADVAADERNGGRDRQPGSADVAGVAEDAYEGDF